MGSRLRRHALAGGAVTTLAAVLIVGAAVNVGSRDVADAAPSPTTTTTTTTPREVRIPLDAALIARTRVREEAQVREAQLAQWYAAVAEKFRPKTGVNWDGIAQCETGGNWNMRGSRYSGGLGFYNGTWSGFGGREFAPNAGMASREEQIVVAERVYARHGLSGWGCKAYG